MEFPRTMWLVVMAAGTLAGTLAGCQSNDKVNNVETCDRPGFTRDCRCQDGRTGVQICQNNGTISNCRCDVGAGEAGGAPTVKGSCYQAHQSGGCDDPIIEACVCAEGPDGDPGCCSEKWDAVCVELVRLLKCKGDCCEVQSTPGCDDPAIESCVCQDDPNCCDKRWDAFCVTLVEGRGCGSCKGSCCEAHDTGGCDDPAIEACVCVEGGTGDPSCCNEKWDWVCVQFVELLSCGTCQ